MPSADYLTAIIGIATNTLQVVVLFVSSDFHQNSCFAHDDRNTPRDLLNRGLLISGVVSRRTKGSPGVLPCCVAIPLRSIAVEYNSQLSFGLRNA